MLRSKGKQYDASFTQRNLSQRDLPAQFVLAQKPSGKQHVLFRIPRNHTNTVAGRSECRTIDEVARQFGWQVESEWTLVIDIEGNNVARTVNLGRFDTLEHVANRQLELLYRHVTGRVETDQRPAAGDKLFQIIDAGLRDATRVLCRQRTRRVSGDDLRASLRRKEQHVELCIKPALPNVSVAR